MERAGRELGGGGFGTNVPFGLLEAALRVDLDACCDEPFDDVETISRGRVETKAVIDVAVDLIERSRNHAYAREPELFTADLNRLIRLKRTISLEEIVLD